MEKSPKAFQTLQEEDLRYHFLVQLNGQYEGQATGETFNLGGKTDILIQYEGRNLFIAECKFWYGPEKLKEAIDQLLGYLTWRDTKTAIIVFNKNIDFNAVLKQIPDIVKSHTNHNKSEGIKNETEFKFVFNQKEDTARQIYLTILVFNIPS